MFVLLLIQVENLSLCTVVVVVSFNPLLRCLSRPNRLSITRQQARGLSADVLADFL